MLLHLVLSHILSSSLLGVISSRKPSLPSQIPSFPRRPVVLVCLRLRGFLGCETCIVQTRTRPGQPGQLVILFISPVRVSYLAHTCTLFGPDSSVLCWLSGCGAWGIGWDKDDSWSSDLGDWVAMAVSFTESGGGALGQGGERVCAGIVAKGYVCLRTCPFVLPALLDQM